jgi:hypothetical protein
MHRTRQLLSAKPYSNLEYAASLAVCYVSLQVTDSGTNMRIGVRVTASGVQQVER